jgi:transcription antitermination factor NusG
LSEIYAQLAEEIGFRSQVPHEVTGRSRGKITMNSAWRASVKNSRATIEPVPEEGFPPHWYAIHTRSRHEKSVDDLLRRKRIESFLPLYETVRQWENGAHHVQLPLFPGYAFVHIALQDRLQVLKVPGVVRLVGFNGAPTPIADHEIEGLRKALVSGVKAAPHPYLTVGRRVRITAGPLAGYTGILVRRKGAVRVVISIDLIQRSVLVSVDSNWLEPAT